MRQGLIGGNWKMNASRAFVTEFADRWTSLHPTPVDDLFLCPPLGFIDALAGALPGALIGAQNVYVETSGAFTGEHSAEMVADLGARFALVGHSERRQLFGEDDSTVAAKFGACQRAGVTPVLCVGETLDERRAGNASEVVARQIDAVVSVAGIGALIEAVVAYEPVWAIGTGETATPQQAQEMHQMIRARLAASDQNVADAIRILYGGSVKADNAALLFAEPDIDGGLVGGASLDAADLSAIRQALPGN